MLAVAVNNINFRQITGGGGPGGTRNTTAIHFILMESAATQLGFNSLFLQLLFPMLLLPLLLLFLRFIAAVDVD